MRPQALLGLFVLVSICLTGKQALADKRVALVIGNSAYQHVPKLPNPERDAEAIGILLKQAGFDSVELESNLSINDMRRVVRDFSEQARDADIAVIYFAGHGLEASGVNYLIPVDASLRRDIDVEDEAVPLDRLLQVTEQTKRLRLVILDACRDNPFANSMTRTMASRAVGRGLARIEPAASNTLVAFAARAGSTAADGDGPHSPFTTGLLKSLVVPDLDIRLALGRVRDEVLRSTAGKQEPFVYGSLGGDAVTLASLTIQDRQDHTPQADPDLFAQRDYDAAAKVSTKEAWSSFLQKYPKGFYSDLARSELAKINGKIAALPTGKDQDIVKDKPSDTRTKVDRKGNSAAIRYYCGSVQSYEEGIKQGITNQRSLDTVRRMCARARAGSLRVDQFGRRFE